MRRGELRKTIQAMYPRGDAADELSEKLEAKAMAEYEAHYTQRRWWTAMLSPHNRVARYAFGILAVVLLTGVACQLPTETPVDMGYHVRVLFAPMDEKANTSDDMTVESDVRAVRPGTRKADLVLEGGSLFGAREFPGSELTAALARVGAEKVEFRMRSTAGQARGLDIFVWGQHVRHADVLDAVEQYVPDGPGMSYDIAPLTGTVAESVGKRIRRALFDIDVQVETAEELRASILKQLAAQGLVGTVDVQDESNGRKITIEAEAPDGSRKLAEEVILGPSDNEQPDN